MSNTSDESALPEHGLDASAGQGNHSSIKRSSGEESHVPKLSRREIELAEYDLVRKWHEETFEDPWLADQLVKDAALINLAENARRESTEILAELRSRNVSKLLHFTNIQNLLSIAQHGLLARTELKQRKITYRANDSRRNDYLPQAISMSLTQPNFPMMASKSGTGHFCILEFDANMLSNTLFLAFPTNAASSSSQHLASLNPSQLVGVRGLLRMFSNGKTKPDSANGDQRFTISREELKLSPDVPTDTQAEIMLLESLPAATIRRIHTALPYDNTSSQLKVLLQHFEREKWHFGCAEYFSLPRSDFKLRDIDPTTIEEPGSTVENAGDHG